MYDIQRVRGYVEVYYNGEFLFTADNEAEAQQEIEEREQNKGALV